MSSNPEESSQMAKLFRCPSCGSALEVVDAPSVTCKYCGSSVPVPAKYRPQKPQAPQVIIQQMPDYSQQYAQAMRGSQRIGCIITLIILLFVGGITVFSILASATAVNTVISEVGSQIEDATGIDLPGATPTPAFAEVNLEFGGEGTGPGLFDDPRTIAVDPDGNIYVADYDDGRVQKFDPTGKFEWLVTTEEDANGNNTIGGLAVDYAGNLYVTRSGDLLKYSTEGGTLIETFPGDFPDTLYETVVVDASNTLYALHVTASDNDLLKLSADGEILARWTNIVGGVNEDDAALDLDLAVDGVGNIYISSSFGKQVYIFDSDGKFTDRFGQEGDDPGAMSSPGAIAVDGRNRVYVNNFGGVDVYDSKGNYINSLPSDYTKGGTRDIAIDIEGNVYVVTTNGIVLKYQLTSKG